MEETKKNLDALEDLQEPEGFENWTKEEKIHFMAKYMDADDNSEEIKEILEKELKRGPPGTREIDENSEEFKTILEEVEKENPQPDMSKHGPPAGSEHCAREQQSPPLIISSVDAADARAEGGFEAVSQAIIDSPQLQKLLVQKLERLREQEKQLRAEAELVSGKGAAADLRAKIETIKDQKSEVKREIVKNS